MTISANDAVATLQFLVPGFVLLSVFYWFGLATKRTDWRWLLWSLLASVPIGWLASWVADQIRNKPADLASTIADCGVKLAADAPATSDLRSGLKDCVSTALTAHNQDLRLLIGVVLAIIGGFVAVWVWHRLASGWPALRRRTEPLAWGSVLREPHWLKVYLEKAVFVGYTLEAADPVEVDAGDLDLYLGEPMETKDDGETFARIPDVEGILIRRGDIKRIEVFAREESEEPTHIHLNLGERLRGWITADRAEGGGS